MFTINILQSNILRTNITWNYIGYLRNDDIIFRNRNKVMLNLS